MANSQASSSPKIGRVVAFLAGDGASYIPATTIFAEGGIMRGSPWL